METGFNTVHWETQMAFGSSETAEDTKPLGVQSLGTLVDLGLSDRQIAQYFGLAEDRVVSLRRYFGLK